jgi:voltage-dependent potassium channel beta subunit
MVAAALDAGINFFDNAEIYANGRSETIMGEVFKQLDRPRLDYLVSTKFFWGLGRAKPGQTPRINGQDTLNRKYLMQAIDGALQRMQMDHIDLVFCHRADPHTPIEETVRAFNDMITQGKVLYWGTSEWSADEIRAAWQIADRNGWHKPVMEQPQYHLFHRKRVEQEYARLYEDIGLGLTTWSPLASGLLTGKYRAGIPEGSRGALESMAFLREGLTDVAKNKAVGELERVAADLGCNVAQLALAWVHRNPHVSTVILGASKLGQLQDNLKALEVAPKLDAAVLERIDGITKALADT